MTQVTVAEIVVYMQEYRQEHPDCYSCKVAQKAAIHFGFTSEGRDMVIPCEISRLASMTKPVTASMKARYYRSIKASV